MKKITMILFYMILAMTSYANTRVSLSIPIIKSYIGTNNSDLDVVSFTVNIDKDIYRIKNIDFGGGLGIQKTPKIFDKNEYIKITGGDATLLSVYTYLIYMFDNGVYLKTNIGYNMVLDSNNMKTQIITQQNSEYETNIGLKSSILFKNEIGYQFTDKSLFVFHEYMPIQSNIGNDYSAFGVGFGINF